MDFALTQEHELIREMAFKFGQHEILPGLAERDRAHTSDATMLEKMAAGGMMGIGLPEKYSGSGTDYIYSVLFVRSLKEQTAQRELSCQFTAVCTA